MQSFSVILHLHLSPSRSCMGTKTLSVELNRYVVIRGRTISRYCVIYSEKWFHCEIASSAYIVEVSIGINMQRKKRCSNHNTLRLQTEKRGKNR